MIKNNKLKTLISSIIILLPMLFGISLWDKLPKYMNIHWNLNGEADGMGSRALLVFLTPLILLAFHLICLLVTSFDRKNKGQNKKALSLVFWIIPALSLYIGMIMYSTVFGKEFKMESITLMLIGVMFTVFGNYMPKIKQNSTLGIKIKWALENEENWNATHRFGGRVWFYSGIVILLCALLPYNLLPIILVAVLLVAALLPTAYSYLYYRKQKSEGRYFAAVGKTPRYIKIIVWVCIAALIAVLSLVTFTGEITVNYAEDSFSVKASFYDDITVKYDDIDNIELRNDDDKGLRTNGFASARLLMGTFKNDEFGSYTRYSYTSCDSAVVLKIDDKALVISGKDTAATKAIYDKLK